jgi:hypothetical protein
MHGKLRNAMRTFGPAVAAIASALLANGVRAAEAPVSADVNPPGAAPNPVEQIETLDEVWVYGKRLSREIEAAEDDFFVLYNKLNKDSQYDVHCGRMALNRGSMLMVRACVPGFIVYNYGDGFGRVSLGSCGSFGSPSFGYYGGGNYGDGYGYYSSDYYGGMGYSGSACYGGFSSGSGVPSAALMMSKRPAYAANVLKVVASDPRLIEKAKDLGVLYKDMELVQGHYVKIKARTPARERKKGASPNRGPRVL